MKKVFVNRFKYSHTKLRKKYKKLHKEGKACMLLRTEDGWLYGDLREGV